MQVELFLGGAVVGGGTSLFNHWLVASRLRKASNDLSAGSVMGLYLVRLVISVAVLYLSWRFTREPMFLLGTTLGLTIPGMFLARSYTAELFKKGGNDK